MKKLICFSLWGDNPKYTIGAIRNAELSPIIYPDWTCRFYIGNDVPRDIVTQLEAFKHVELYHKKSESWDSMFWRFDGMADEVDYYISRDTDSRLNLREKAAVDAWINSGKNFHIMRDHKWHIVKIMGGMHGCKGGVIQDINELIYDWVDKLFVTSYYQIDQEFLAHVVYPKICDSLIVHDDFIKCPWPTSRENNQYVGSPYDENDNLLIPFIP